MNPIFEAITAIYKKDPKEMEVNTSICLTLTKWLSYDCDNLEVLSSIFPFIFYLSSQHYYYILWLNIPAKSKVPYLKKYSEDKEETESELVKKIQKVLGWSSRELLLHKKIINDVILKDEKKWKERMGIK